MTGHAPLPGALARRALRLGLPAIFVLALLPRLLYPVSRPMEWYFRSVAFWDALAAGDLAGTYQRYHPGVTTMWIAGAGLRVYALAHGQSAADLLAPPDLAGGYFPFPVEAGVAALAVAIALGIALAYGLLVRLWGWRVGLAGAALLALDPLYLEQSKVLHLDAVLATTCLLSVLFLLRHVQSGRRVHFWLSALCGGLAFLTKSPAIVLAPWAVMALGYRCLLAPPPAAVDGATAPAARPWPQRLGLAARDLALWGLVVIAVFCALWPAMWVAPGPALAEMAQRAAFHVETVHRNPNYFMGRAILADPGPLFTLATIGWKTSAVSLLGLLAALALLLGRIRRWREHSGAWLVLAFGCGFTLLMMLAARKEIRYLTPALPALDVLAGWGLVEALAALGRLRALRRLAWLPGALLAGALAVAALDVLPVHPYYGVYHNRLLGGARVAQHILPLGDQGEGVDQAARFLNTFGGAETRRVGVDRRFDELFERIFRGHSVGHEMPALDYYVFTRNAIERENGIEVWGAPWQALKESEPLFAADFQGVRYVWVYPAYPTAALADQIELRLDATLGAAPGDQARLLGCRITPRELAPGQPLTVTLVWQSDGRIARRYHVFVHLQDASGAMRAQADGEPVSNSRPTTLWRPREVLEDAYTLVVPADAPPGVYLLTAGMYGLPDGQRLAATLASGERPADGRVPLGEVTVGAR